MIWLFLLAIAALLVCVGLIRRMQRQRAQQQRMKERMRSSRMYAGLGLMLRSLPVDYIERVDVRQQGVTVLLLGGKQARYLFEEHDTDDVRPDAMPILAQAVATDLPAVQDTDYFKLHRIKNSTPGGEPIISYIYTLNPSRKNYLLRAMKDKGTL